jgi:hypothetical protein
MSQRTCAAGGAESKTAGSVADAGDSVQLTIDGPGLLAVAVLTSKPSQFSIRRPLSSRMSERGGCAAGRLAASTGFGATIEA